MPRIIKTTVYKYDELSEQAKENALEQFAFINVDYDWWESTYEDAENVGLKITDFNTDRGNSIHGKILTSAPEVIESILENHGKHCDTYTTAARFKPKFELIEWQMDVRDNEDYTKYPNVEYDRDALEDKFLHDILEDYLSMLKKEYEYQTSREAIEEVLQANEYEFTADGKHV